MAGAYFMTHGEHRGDSYEVVDHFGWKPSSFHLGLRAQCAQAYPQSEETWQGDRLLSRDNSDKLLGLVDRPSDPNAEKRWARVVALTAAGILGLIVVILAATMACHLRASSARPFPEATAVRPSGEASAPVLRPSGRWPVAAEDMVCDEDVWPGKISVCSECKVLVRSFRAATPERLLWLRNRSHHRRQHDEPGIKSSRALGQEVLASSAYSANVSIEDKEPGTCRAYCGNLSRLCLGCWRAPGDGSCLPIWDYQFSCDTLTPAGRAICKCGRKSKKLAQKLSKQKEDRRIREQAQREQPQREQPQPELPQPQQPTPPLEPRPAPTERPQESTSDEKAGDPKAPEKLPGPDQQQQPPPVEQPQQQPVAQQQQVHQQSVEHVEGQDHLGTNSSGKEPQEGDSSYDEISNEDSGKESDTESDAGTEDDVEGPKVLDGDSEWEAEWSPEGELCHAYKDDTDLRTESVLTHMNDILSADDCDKMCTGNPECGAWSWGKARDVAGLSDVCFLKTVDHNWNVSMENKVGVLSGMPKVRGRCMVVDGKTEVAGKTPLITGVIKNRHGQCLEGGPNGTRVHMWTCIEGEPRQQWVFDRFTGRIKNQQGLCLDAHDRLTEYSQLTTLECNEASWNQQWSYFRNLGFIKQWSGICLDGAEPNVDGGDVYMRTCNKENWNQLWSIGPLSFPATPAKKAGTSLYCFALMMPGSYEEVLLKDQFQQNVSLFQCEEYAVYSNQTIPVSDTFQTGVVDSDLQCKKGGEFGTALNLQIFISVWQKVLKDGAFFAARLDCEGGPRRRLLRVPPPRVP